MHPKVVLAIGAHPDDIDYAASGTLAHFARQGADVHYLQLTDAGSGSSDRKLSTKQVTKVRQQEQRAACAAIGGTSVEFLNYKDGCLENSMDLKTDIVRTIRRLKPDVVITLDPTMIYDAELGMINHPDHRAAGQATLDAVYPLARDHLSLPKLLKAGLEPHKVATVLLINFTEQNFFVDITDKLDEKVAAIQAHASQFPDKQAIEQKVTEQAKTVGEKAGYNYAEGFVRINIAP